MSGSIPRARSSRFRRRRSAFCLFLRSRLASRLRLPPEKARLICGHRPWEDVRGAAGEARSPPSSSSASAAGRRRAAPLLPLCLLGDDRCPLVFGLTQGYRRRRCPRRHRQRFEFLETVLRPSRRQRSDSSAGVAILSSPPASGKAATATSSLDRASSSLSRATPTSAATSRPSPLVGSSTSSQTGPGPRRDPGSDVAVRANTPRGEARSNAGRAEWERRQGRNLLIETSAEPSTCSVRSVSRLRLSFVRARTSVGWRLLHDGSSVETTSGEMNNG